MQDEVRITVPFDVSRASLNRRLHWRARRDINLVAKRAAWVAWQEAGCPVIEGAARVSVLVRRARLLDWDNAVSGCKAALDMLTSRKKLGKGVVWDDGPAWLTFAGLTQEIDAKWKGREEILFTFRPQEEADGQAVSGEEPSRDEPASGAEPRGERLGAASAGAGRRAPGR